MKETLIVFTRYPEPGKTKTRLIPVLGTEGAALLHRRLTEQTLVQVRNFQGNLNVNQCDRLLSIEVYFNGGCLQLMQNWLGTDLIYQPQAPGDLGAKMLVAFESSFQAGSHKVVIIGTDCPDLRTPILAHAFDELSQCDLVLGPATDGGYYLIGLCRSLPELFQGIHWGTASVLAQTQAIAKTLNLIPAYLPILSDIDRPEDLSILHLKD